MPFKMQWDFYVYIYFDAVFWLKTPSWCSRMLANPLRQLGHMYIKSSWEVKVLEPIHNTINFFLIYNDKIIGYIYTLLSWVPLSIPRPQGKHYFWTYGLVFFKKMFFSIHRLMIKPFSTYLKNNYMSTIPYHVIVTISILSNTNSNVYTWSHVSCLATEHMHIIFYILSFFNHVINMNYLYVNFINNYFLL